MTQAQQNMFKITFFFLPINKKKGIKKGASFESFSVEQLLICMQQYRYKGLLHLNQVNQSDEVIKFVKDKTVNIMSSAQKRQNIFFFLFDRETKSKYALVSENVIIKIIFYIFRSELIGLDKAQISLPLDRKKIIKICKAFF